MTQKCSELRGRIGPHPQCDVIVELQGGLDRVVAQALAHGLDVDTSL